MENYISETEQIILKEIATKGNPNRFEETY
jgi:hypothetical protein